MDCGGGVLVDGGSDSMEAYTGARAALSEALKPTAAMFAEHVPYEHLDVAYVLEGVVMIYVGWFLCVLACSVTPVFKEKPMVAAYYFVGLVPVCLLAYEGMALFFTTPLPETPEKRAYDPIDGACRICMIQIVYQIFGIGVAFIARGTLLSPVMLVHHVCTLTLGVLNLGPFVHYHIIFFGGVIELSNIPLSIMDIFKTFKNLQNSMPALNDFCRYTFALSFLVLRLVLWLKYGFRFHMDCIYILRNDLAKSTATVVLNQVLNVILTAMQLHWASKIVRILVKAFGGSSSEKKTA